MSTLSSLQLTADMKGLDAQSKTILRSAKVLAVILRETVTEYKGYSRKEVMDFIEKDSITDTKEVLHPSSQLSLITERTDYSQLEKCYSIWICRDDIPKEERYTISVYEVANTKNIGINALAKENYDLMTLVVIKLGNTVCNGKKEDEGYDLLRFLNAIMYPHRGLFMATVSDYIDFSENEELWKEAERMDGLGECICNEIWEEAREETRNAITARFISGFFYTF